MTIPTQQAPSPHLRGNRNHEQVDESLVELADRRAYQGRKSHSPQKHRGDMWGGNDVRGDLPPRHRANHQMSEQRSEARPRKAPRTDSMRSEQRGHKEDQREHPAQRQPVRREHSRSAASMSIFDLVGRSAGDIDKERGRDLRDRLRHSKRLSPSISSRSANQPRHVRPAFGELDELRAWIEDLAFRAEGVGNDNHSPFTREIKEEPLPHGFKMPQILSYEEKTESRDHLNAFNDQIDLLQVNDLAKCHCFAVTLTQVAKKWFRKLPAN